MGGARRGGAGSRARRARALALLCPALLLCLALLMGPATVALAQEVDRPSPARSGAQLVDALRTALASPADVSAAQAALAGLGLLAVPELQALGPALAPVLIDVLRHPDTRLHLQAWRLLLRIDAGALPALDAAIQGPDPYVRRVALTTLSGIAGATSAALTQIAGALDHIDEDAREQAEDLLRRKGVFAPPPALLAALRASRPSARAAACRLVARSLARFVPPPPAAPALVAGLVEALRDADTRVRREAALDLDLALFYGQAPIAAARVALRSALSDPDASVQGYAARSLGRLGRAALPDLLSALSSANPARRRLGAVGLGFTTQSAPEALAPLLAALSDPAAEVRAAAALALGNEQLYPTAAPHAPLVDALGSALADEDAPASLAAAQTLADFGAAALPALPDLLRGLEHPDPARRLACVEALGSIGPGAQPAVEALSARLDDPASDVRREVARSLSAIGPGASPALLALAGAVNDEAAPVRDAAERAIQVIAAATRATHPAPWYLVPRAFWQESAILGFLYPLWFGCFARLERPRRSWLRFLCAALPPSLMACVFASVLLDHDWVAACLPATPAHMPEFRISIYPSLVLLCALAAVWATARSGVRIRAARDLAELAALESEPLEPSLPGGAEGQAPEHEQER